LVAARNAACNAPVRWLCAAQGVVVERAHPKQAARMSVGAGPQRVNRRQLSECAHQTPLRVFSHKAKHTPQGGPNMVARGDGIQSPEAEMPRIVEVEEQRDDGSEEIGEVAKVFPIWGGVLESGTFDIKK
jgi:hypothetical protein